MSKHHHKPAAYPSNIHIYCEASPNPLSMKFVLNFMLTAEGESYDFPSAKSASFSPLAQALFGFEYVERVFLMNNFITLTKTDATDWAALNPKIRAFIGEYFKAGKLVFCETKADDTKTVEAADSVLVGRIKAILEEYVKPAVEMDGGAIRFHSFEEDSGRLNLLLQGACSGCPSAGITLKSGIQNLMQKMIPQIKEVVAKQV